MAGFDTYVCASSEWNSSSLLVGYNTPFHLSMVTSGSRNRKSARNMKIEKQWVKETCKFKGVYLKQHNSLV